MVDGTNPLATDPSDPAVWLPDQNASYATPNGNHVPQWVVTAVQID